MLKFWGLDELKLQSWILEQNGHNRTYAIKRQNIEMPRVVYSLGKSAYKPIVAKTFETGQTIRSYAVLQLFIENEMFYHAKSFMFYNV